MPASRQNSMSSALNSAAAIGTSSATVWPPSRRAMSDESRDVEVAVQIASESEERPAIVVAVAIKNAVERVLHGLSDRLGDQDDNQRREQRDDPVVLVGIVREEIPRGWQEREEIEQRCGREETRVRDGALDDHFHVAQPVPDDGRREGQGHDAKRNRGEL